MRIRTATFVLFFAMAVARGTAAAPESPPSEWRRIEAPGFSFHVPPDMKSSPVRPIDSLVRAYEGKAISLSFDLGQYADSLDYEGKRNFTARRESIGGRDARIVSFDNPGSGHPFDYAIAVHFPSVNEAGEKLTFFATCKSAADYATVRRIFRTIRFE